MALGGLTRAQVLRVAAGALAGSALAACGAPSGGGSSGASGGAPGAPAKRPVTLIVDNDWTQGDRLTVVKAWLERANKVHPHIKTELRDNADSIR